MTRIPTNTYKLGAQGMTLPVRGTTAGERETARDVALNTDSQVHTPDFIPSNQCFSFFLLFCSFFFFCSFGDWSLGFVYTTELHPEASAKFLFPGKNLFLELSMVPSENSGGPGKNVCFNYLNLLMHHGVTFLYVAQLWNLKWFSVPNDPVFLISNPL